MITRMFSIYDAAVECFNAPFNARTVQEAHRSFALAVTRGGDFANSPRDYTLFEVGSFDDTTGALDTLDAPRRVISAAECIAAAKESA